MSTEVLLTIVGAIAVLLLILLLLVSMRPSEFRITRTGTVEATPEAVFEHVNSLRKWDAWSPWAKLDPNQKNTYEGPDAGVGASHAWNGNNKVGEGKMTIKESVPAQRVGMVLEFVRPMKAVNDVVFDFTPDSGKTVIVWTMTGKNGFAGKMFDFLMNMDKMVGKDFEKGLATLKQVVEAETKK